MLINKCIHNNIQATCLRCKLYKAEWDVKQLRLELERTKLELARVKDELKYFRV